MPPQNAGTGRAYEANRLTRSRLYGPGPYIDEEKMEVEIEDRDLQRSQRLAWIAIIVGAIGMLVVLLNAAFGYGVGSTSAAFRALQGSSVGKTAEDLRKSVTRTPVIVMPDAAREPPPPVRSEGPATAPKVELGAIPPSKSAAWKDEPPPGDTTVVPDSPAEFENIVNALLVSKPAEFRPNGAILTWNGKSNLDLVLPYLKAKPNWKFDIAVHVAPGENAQADQSLTTSRAEAIAGYFGSEGIYSTRMTLKGYGSSKPVADNSTEVGRLKNQRVEIKVSGTN